MKRLMMCVCAVLVGTAFAADCVWTGAAGDGKWNTPGNWDGNAVPVNGDKLTLSGASGSEMENNIENLSIQQISFIGSDPVHLTGNGFTINSSTIAYAWTNTCPLVCDVPLTVRASGSIWNQYMIFEGETHFYREVNAPSDRKINFHIRPTVGKPVYFHAPVTAQKIGFESASNALYFYEGVTSTVYMSSSTFSDTGSYWTYFYKPIKSGDYFNITFRRFRCMAADILDPSALLTFTGWPTGGQLDLNGFDQTVNCVTGIFTTSSTRWPNANNDRAIGSSSPATFTMRATISSEHSTIFTGSTTIKYAPTSSDLVMTFNHRTNTTTGALLIMDGTIRLATAAKFSNLPYIYLGPTAALEIDAANGIANPFPALRTVELETGGKLKLPSGVALTAARVVKGGVPLPIGVTYTSADGWIEGDGTLTVSDASTSSTTTWLGDSGGWNTAANWSAGVPSVLKAAVVEGLQRQDVSVTVSDDAAAATNLTVLSECDGKVKLYVDALLPFSNAWLTFGQNTEVEVGDGGELSYTGTANAGNASDLRMLVNDGATVKVKNGGRVTFTDVAGQVQIGTSAASTGTLTIEEGGEVSMVQGLKNAHFGITDGGRVDVKGLLSVARRFGNNSSRVYQQNGSGVLDVSGNGMVKIASVEDTQGGAFELIGGTANFSDSAALATVPGGNWNMNVYFGASTLAGSAPRVTFTGNSCISNFIGSLTISGQSEEGAYLDMSSVNEGFWPSTGANFYSLYVGYNAGKGRFDFGGKSFKASLYGIYVGRSNSASAAGYGSGELTIMNGAAAMCGGTAAMNRSSANATRLVQFYGTLIGHWLTAPSSLGAGVRPEKGLMRLKGATSSHTLSDGHFVVGAGCAEGRYIQEDGTNIVVSTTWSGDTWSTNSVMAVGLLGGWGDCVVSNGLFKSNVRTFVGGCKTNEYFDGTYFSYGTGKWVADLHNAEGRLCIAGGKFMCNKEVYVGSDGSGTVEIGPTGSFAANALVLSNQTASVARFVFGPAGVGAATVERLEVAPGAKLSVDVGAYTGRKPKFRLITAGAVQGAFAAGDIEIDGGTAAARFAAARVEQTATGVNLLLPSGTAIILR